MAPRGPTSAIVLATGRDPQMRSSRPKALHRLCGRAMLMYVLDALVDFGVDRAVVVGGSSELLNKKLSSTGPDLFVEFIEHDIHSGSAEAALIGLTPFPPDMEDSRDVIVVPADMPLLQDDALATLVAHHRAADAVCTVLTADGSVVDGPAVVRGPDDRVKRLEAVHTLTEGEVAPGLFCFRQSVLGPALRRIQPGHEHSEALHAVVEVLDVTGYAVEAVACEDSQQLKRVVDRLDLADIEGAMRRRTNRRWLRAGVNMVDPDRTAIDTTVRLSPDVTLFPGTLLQGDTVVGERAEIGPDTRLVDCAVGADAVIEKTMARDAEIGAGAHVGPFAVLESGAHVDPGVATGAFYTA